jgi:hypothetical protein
VRSAITRLLVAIENGLAGLVRLNAQPDLLRPFRRWKARSAALKQLTATQNDAVYLARAKVQRADDRFLIVEELPGRHSTGAAVV